MATFAEVLNQAPGTLVRRASWPAHWWCTVDVNGEQHVLRYTATIDLGSHPLGEAALGQTVTYFSVKMGDAVANDWEVIQEPPVETDESLSPSLAIWVTSSLAGTRLQPLSKCPELQGYRTMTVIVPDNLFAPNP